MLTVTLGLEESGKRRTWSPLGRAYSVMPSRSVIFRTPWGRVWESAVKAKIRRSGNNALLRVMSHLDRWGFRRIITGDVWGGARFQECGSAQRRQFDAEARRGGEKRGPGGALCHAKKPRRRELTRRRGFAKRRRTTASG